MEVTIIDLIKSSESDICREKMSEFLTVRVHALTTDRCRIYFECLSLKSASPKVVTAGEKLKSYSAETPLLVNLATRQCPSRGMAALLELRRDADQILVELEHRAKYEYSLTSIA
jgi:hypothetical protein